jgi:hypothetical protein
MVSCTQADGILLCFEGDKPFFHEAKECSIGRPFLHAFSARSLKNYATEWLHERRAGGKPTLRITGVENLGGDFL